MGLLNLRFHKGEKKQSLESGESQDPPQETATEAWEKAEEGEARRVKDYLKQHGGVFPGQGGDSSD